MEIEKSKMEWKPTSADFADDQKGMVVSLAAHRGFGFILGSMGRQFFFHATDVLEPPFFELRTGMNVRFKLADTPRGLKAIAISRLGEVVKRE